MDAYLKMLLGWNELSPSKKQKLTNLKKLNLKNNGKLYTLPESIENLTSLQVLHAWNNNLASLPESIGELRNLQELNLNENNLTSLPESIGKLTSLKRLDLWTNQLTYLPDGIGKLTSLQILGLGDNGLTSLPDNIGQLTQLKELYVRVNQLTNLPESIGKLTNLQILHLQDNKLASLPESLCELIMNTKINVYLENNQLPEVTINNRIYTILCTEYVHEGRITYLPLSKSIMHAGMQETVNIIQTYKEKGIKINYFKALKAINKALGANYNKLEIAVKENTENQTVQNLTEIIDYNARQALENKDVLIDNTSTDVSVNKYKVWL